MKNFLVFFITCIVCLTMSVYPIIADGNATFNSTAIDGSSLNITGSGTIGSILSGPENDQGPPDKIAAGNLPVGAGGTSSIGVFRPSTKEFILNTNPVTRIQFGLSTDKPVTGDWNGDGFTDIGVFRSGQFILDTNNDGVVDSRVNFGLSSDVPVTGDWDDDGYDEIGVFRLGQFILDYTNNNWQPVRNGEVWERVNFGLGNDIPVPIDWNDDGLTELAVFRQSTCQWIIRLDNIIRFTYGLSTDTPFRYWREDSTTQIGVFRPAANDNWIFNDGPARMHFGSRGDIPITGKEWASRGPPLGVPVLITPPNGTVFNHYPRDTYYEWDPVSGATGYLHEIQFYDRGSEKWRAWRGTIISETSLTSKFVGAQPGRWRVIALDSTGLYRSSPPSEWREFEYLV